MTRRLALALLLAACDGPALAADAGSDAAMASDGGQPTDSGSPPTMDSGSPPTDDAGPGDAAMIGLTVTFTAPPPSITHVRGTVDLQLVVQGGAVESVELWKDGAILVVLAPPYTYRWNTDPETEGVHQLEARAILAGEIAGRAERSFVVDRTPPTIVNRTPMADASVALADPIEIVFSEPIASPGLAAAITLTTSGTPLAHTVEQPVPERVDVRVTEAPAILPATATITAGAAITDLAGNPLGADHAWSFTYPVWVEHEPVADPGSILDATLAPDGTVWILYRETTPTPGLDDLRAAYWSGGVWSEIAAPAREAGGIARARIRIRPSGRAVVAWTGIQTDATIETRVRELNGATWVSLAIPPRESEWVHGLDLDLEADGAVVLSRQLENEYVVHRYGTSWAAIGTPLPAVDQRGYESIDLLPSPDGVCVAYVSEYDCKFVREDGGSWTAPIDIHASLSSTSRCKGARLVRSGADGQLHAFVGYSSSSTVVRVESDAGYWEVRSAGGYLGADSWFSVAPSTSGWYALGWWGTQRRLVDETLLELTGPTRGSWVFAVGDRPIIVSDRVIEQNDLP